MEEAVTFINNNGKKLFGIIHIPEANIPREMRIGINLLNPGIKYRVAPHRLNVKLARILCAQGYYVLRFDPEGTGDSEGNLPEGLLTADIWERIQKGLFISDVMSANDFFIQNYEIEQLILIGNCGGAITALLTSEKDSRIEGLVLVDVPVNLRVAQQTFADKVAPGGKKADWLFSEYLKRLLRPASWYRLITFKSNYRALYKTMMLKLKRDSSFPDNDLDTLCVKHNLNRLFYQSFEAFSNKKKPILFIVAGNDKGTEIFETFFQSICLNPRKDKGNIQVYKIDRANHIYTLTEWQELLINHVLTWTNNIVMSS